MRPARSIAGCYSCRLSLLRQFVGCPLQTPLHANRQVLPALRRPSEGLVPQRRLLSSLDPTAKDGKQSATAPEEEAVRTELEIDDDATAANPSEDEVPWYLEVEPPRHPTLIPEPPRLPNIPEDSPRLIKPLLDFASDDLGLDDLNLMDLRALDPPAALGPKLLMLFGTARSQRHLHVSADRLVRWARGRGLGATADGLLGRNELKTKLRRKARKAKLLGQTASLTEDDGIATRWICVNFVTTAWVASEEAEITANDGTVSGFGAIQTGTTIVVQMFTESRRQELDLEGLWNRVLKRSQGQLVPEDEPSPPERSRDPIVEALAGSVDLHGERSKSVPQ